MITISRVIVLACCLASFVILLNRFRVGRSTWNTKTRDYWYALTMWSFASACASLEGMFRHLPGRYSIVFSIVASLVTLSGVLRRGAWGGEDKNHHAK